MPKCFYGSVLGLPECSCSGIPGLPKHSYGSILGFHFLAKSLLELCNFLLPPIAEKLNIGLCKLNKCDGLSANHPLPILPYVTSSGSEWHIKGLPYKWQYNILKLPTTCHHLLPLPPTFPLTPFTIILFTLSPLPLPASMLPNTPNCHYPHQSSFLSLSHHIPTQLCC